MPSFFLATTVRAFLTVAVTTLLIIIMSTTTTTTFVSALSFQAGSKTQQFYGGAGVGRFVVEEYQPEQWACHYDMVLVERIQGRPPTESGLFVPQADLPKLHLCRVLSMGSGREEENGFIAPMPQIQVGDIVIAKNPWGIGPKDEETSDGKKLSFMRAQDIAAVVTGGLMDE